MLIIPYAHRLMLRNTIVIVSQYLTVIFGCSLLTQVCADELLLSTNLDVQVTDTKTLSLTPRGTDSGPITRQPPPIGTLRGRVIDGRNTTPLADATVLVAGNTTTTTTELAGYFMLRSVDPGEYALTVRVLGYVPPSRSVRVLVGRAATIEFELPLSMVALDQVVTTATGGKQLNSIGNMIGTVNADSLVPTTPVTSLSDVLNARVARVQVIDTGLPGASPPIYVRGLGSLSTPTQPLLYIDGVTASNSTAATSTIGEGVAAGRLNDLVPDEIESIEVGKGPAAATLYGTDATNGIILVTTKHGVSGSPRWTAYAEAGEMTTDSDQFPFNYSGWGHSSGQVVSTCTLGTVTANPCTRDSVTRFTPLRAQSLTPLGTGNRGDRGLQVSGGSLHSRYFVSGDYAVEVGYINNPVSDRRLPDSLNSGSARGSFCTHPNAANAFDGRVNRITDRDL